MALRLVYYIFFFFLYASVLAVSFYEVEENVLSVKENGYVFALNCQGYRCDRMLQDFLAAYPFANCAFYDIEREIIDVNSSNMLIFDENYFGFGTSVTSKGLMHHKFCTTNNFVLTGTWNPTKRGTFYNDNYVLLISSPTIALFFNQEYYQLGKTKQKTPLHEVQLPQGKAQVFFCPQDNCENQVIDVIKQANKSIDVLAFTFTSTPIAQALEEAAQRNISVRIIFEKTRITKYSAWHLLNDSVIRCHDANPYTMHEKLFLIDDNLTIAGSYNPTKQGTTKNDENLLFLEGFDQVRTVLTQEFARLYNASKEQNLCV